MYRGPRNLTTCDRVNAHTSGSSHYFMASRVRDTWIFTALHYTFVDFTGNINNKNPFPLGKKINAVVLKALLQNTLIYNIGNNYLR